MMVHHPVSTSHGPVYCCPDPVKSIMLQDIWLVVQSCHALVGMLIAFLPILQVGASTDMLMSPECKKAENYNSAIKAPAIYCVRFASWAHFKRNKFLRKLFCLTFISVLQTQQFKIIGYCVYLDLYKGRKDVLFNDALNTFFIYGYMASDIWLRTILIVRKETHCRHIGYSFQLAARVLLYAPSHRQDITYHSLCYTSHGALAGTRNSSMGLKKGRKCFI